MSKKIIAGAGVVASLAVALAPLATFADTTTQVSSHTDSFSLTIPQVCTLGTVTAGEPDAGTDATTHTGSTWATTTAASGTTGKTDTFSKNVYNGQAYEGMATTTFTIRCNDADGYTLSARSATNDGEEQNAKATLVNGSYTILSQTGKSSSLTTNGNSYWNFELGSASTGLAIASGFDADHVIPVGDTVIATGANGNTNDGQSVTVTYNAGIDDFQEAGTYEGSVIYTLTALDPVAP